MHILGEETMEQKEENTVATRDTCWSSCRNCLDSWHCYSCHDYWYSCVCGT
uniref:Uncharacterized protein n=1 Tax=Malurus cyaneus samueli TaxID=2593467 RepID=A0A8C5X913_9PASS